ncbi:MAG TPA: LLM class flavin-dependent oxidoreductase [Pseudonocardiaceae bacterium]|nr:LLM class flavin-dependent oxidoreductase [Pseudonocardiaceae bacterium]
MPTIKIGVSLSANNSIAAAELPERARHAEQAGLDSAFVGDHLAGFRPILDSTVVLAGAAAVTSRIELGYGTMVLALRQVAWAAKQVATLQQLAQGRVILGVGIGGPMYGESAWHAVGVPYRERGKRTDAALELLPDLIAGKPTVLNGHELTLAPGATVPPIWIGGGSDAAVRRAVRHGSAWFPSMMTAQAARPAIARLTEFADAEQRPVPMLTMGGVAGLGSDKSTVEEYAARLASTYGIAPEQAAKLPISGSTRQAADRFAEFAEAGVRHLVLGIAGGDWERTCDLIAEAKAFLD